MKRLLLIAMMVMVAPAFAETAQPAPSVPVNKGAKTDFTKPFVYDALSRQAPPPPQDHPTVELKAGPGAK